MHYLLHCDPINGCDKDYPGDLPECPHCGAPQWAASPGFINPRDYVYDIETYPNAFTCRFIHIATDRRWRFEVSHRINQLAEFVAFLLQLKAQNARMVGYNNVGFDYPVIHTMAHTPAMTVEEIYNKAMSIIKPKDGDRFGHMVWERDRIVEQLDLILIWHYNKRNEATGVEPTSLKALEFAMRMGNIEDLPFPVGTILNDAEIDELHVYNDHDCVATCLFYVRSLTAIKLREDLSQSFGKNFMNMSNTKMGETILVDQMEKAGIQCYDKSTGRSVKRQTIRTSINLNDAVFPYIKFDHPEFRKILDYFRSKVITETKGVFEGLIATVDGLEYKFGTGGLHASVNGEMFHTTDTMQIIDVDVASFYPNLAIKNKLFPAHLGVAYCDAYEGIYGVRKSYAKKTAENAAYKEALNASYGNSNNKYSVLFDSFYTMATTINGQLMLCMLVEQLIKTPGLRMIQANTDGVTFYCPVQHIEHTRALCRWWETYTLLELEEALYSRMWVRDVNSYISEYESGALKRIGAYAHERMDQNPGTRELPYHKDSSSLVVQKAAEAFLVHGTDIATFITNHADNYDFMLRAKVPRASKLVMRYPEFDNWEVPLPNIARYYVTHHGGSLVKISPPTGTPGTWKRQPKTKVTDEFYHAVIREIMAGPFAPGMVVDAEGVPHDPRIHTKNMSKHEIREMGICVGWKVSECNDVKKFDRSAVNYDYYINEAKKLVDCYN